MSYLMTHLIIANEFAKKRNIENKDLFILASSAPDAVHSRKDFTFEMKSMSHEHPKDVEWGHIHTREAMESWYGDLPGWYQEKCTLVTNQKEKDFLDGYLLHMLTDIFNCKLLYGKELLRHHMDVDGMRPEYRRQCIFQDEYLYQDYEEAKEIFENLRRIVREENIDEILTNLGFSDLISAENIADSIARNEEKYVVAEPVNWEDIYGCEDSMISQEGTWNYINTVLEEADRLLFSFPEAGDTFVIEEVGK